jgi:hypothetical protein
VFLRADELGSGGCSCAFDRDDHWRVVARVGSDGGTQDCEKKQNILRGIFCE